MKIRPHLSLRLALPLMALALIVPSLSSQGQGNGPRPPVPLINQSDNPLLSSFKFRSIGPASMGGRIDDIAVSESDPSIIYLGYAVGGVFRSENNGTTFEPVFETYGTASIGDIAIHPTNPNIVYVGTGEANNRQTSSASATASTRPPTAGRPSRTSGCAKRRRSPASSSIPKNPETVYVASPGHLFGPNPERGIFKTTDGGKTWDKIKFIDDDTGFTDIAHRSSQHQHPLRGELPAAAQRLLLQRRRSGQRDLEDDRRWQDVDEADRQRAAAGHLRPHRARRVALEPERRLCADRGRRGRPADDNARERSERGDGGHASWRSGRSAARRRAGNDRKRQDAVSRDAVRSSQ